VSGSLAGRGYRNLKAKTKRDSSRALRRRRSEKNVSSLSLSIMTVPWRFGGVTCHGPELIATTAFLNQSKAPEMSFFVKQTSPAYMAARQV